MAFRGKRIALILVGASFVAVILRFCSFEKASSIRRHDTKQFREATRTNVLIISQGRGGSTLLGELFNNNPDVFYVFEPLYFAGAQLDINVFYDQETQEYGPKCLDILRSFHACDFSNQSDLLHALCGHSFRTKSKALGKSNFCSERFQRLRGVVGSVSHACMEKKHTVSKVLVSRLPNKTIESLKLLLDRNYDIKILQLVRDPRPVVNSWVKTAWINGTEDPEFAKNVHRICNPIQENVLLGKSQREWLQGRYKLVHYEDLAVNTIKVAREIYNFVGITWAPEVEKWIQSRSIASEKRNPVNPYSTVRNGTVEVTRWVFEAPRDLIRIVEEVCASLMENVGYKRMKVLEKD